MPAATTALLRQSRAESPRFRRGKFGHPAIAQCSAPLRQRILGDDESSAVSNAVISVGMAALHHDSTLGRNSKVGFPCCTWQMRWPECGIQMRVTNVQQHRPKAAAALRIIFAAGGLPLAFGQDRNIAGLAETGGSRKIGLAAGSEW